MCYSIIPVLCSVFRATRHAGSQLPEQGSNMHPLPWDVQSQPLTTASPWVSLISLVGCNQKKGSQVFPNVNQQLFLR